MLESKLGGTPITAVLHPAARSQGPPTEVEISEVLLPSAARLLGLVGPGWMMFSEVPTGTRIPDLLACRLNDGALASRSSEFAERLLSSTEIGVLAMLNPRRPTGLGSLESHFAVRPDHFRRTLAALERDGFLFITGAGTVRRNPSYLPVADEIVSIEVKLSDWRTALVQARAHSRYADRSFVSFDSRFAKRFERAKTAFQSNRIGLISVDFGTGGSEVALRATRSRRQDRIARAIASERLWASLTFETRPLPETRLPNASARNDGRAPIPLS